MDLQKIERYVDDRLELSGINNESVGPVVYTALRHVLVGVGIHEAMTIEERSAFALMRKEAQNFFASKFNLKERKRSKEKKCLPPHPLLKEKETKEKEEKTPPRVCDAKTAFHDECLGFANRYDNQLLADFFNYWSEENPQTGKMRFQGKRYWDTEKRLRRWVKNSYASADTAAALRLKRVQKQQDKETAAAQQQEQAAAERQQQDAAREQAQQESRERQMTTDEYAEAHPDSFLARRWREKQQKEKVTQKQQKQQKE